MLSLFSGELTSGSAARGAVPQAFPGAVSLDSYMLLPVEQYFVLDPRQIRHLGANRFLLLVPRINVSRTPPRGA